MLEKLNGQSRSRMDNPETLATLATRDTERGLNKNRKQEKMSNTDSTKNRAWTQLLAKGK